MKYFFASILLILATTVATAETYTFDPTHTYITWHVNHMGFSNLSGKWLANGTLEFDEKKPKESKVNVTLKMAELTTGIPKLDEHLKDQDFFDVSKYPTATFVSDKVSVVGKRAKVYGTLTIKGISKPAVLNVKFNKSGVNPVSKKQAVGFSGTTELKRSDFGIDKYTPGVGDAVEIGFEAEAVR